MTNRERAEMICESNGMPKKTRLAEEIAAQLDAVFSIGYEQGAAPPKKREKTRQEIDRVLGTELCACGMCNRCQMRNCRK